MAEQEITRVIFRRWFKKKDAGPFGDTIIALFVDEKERRPGMVMSYMHHGQHGAADIEMVMRETKRAAPEEYGPLKKELERPPFEYRFKVLKRRPHV
jgi:hypothetical protein